MSEKRYAASPVAGVVKDPAKKPQAKAVKSVRKALFFYSCGNTILIFSTVRLQKHLNWGAVTNRLQRMFVLQAS